MAFLLKLTRTWGTCFACTALGTISGNGQGLPSILAASKDACRQGKLCCRDCCPPDVQTFPGRRCVSPDAPTNPVLYWLGRFDPAATEFLLEGSKGPIRLDLGDVLYAPNIQTDALVSTVSHSRDCFYVQRVCGFQSLLYASNIQTDALVRPTLQSATDCHFGSY